MNIQLKKMLLAVIGGIAAFQLLGCEVDVHGHHHWWGHHDHPDVVVVH